MLVGEVPALVLAAVAVVREGGHHVGRGRQRPLAEVGVSAGLARCQALGRVVG